MKDKLKDAFICPEKIINPEIEQPASYLRKTFYIEENVTRAVCYMTALGVYEGYVNEARIGNQVLTPGYTNYKSRLQYQEYDITMLVHTGVNVIGIVLGDGWYRGCIDIGSVRNAYGTHTAVSCCIRVEYQGGKTEYLISDESWRATQNGPLRENNLKTLERYDATMEIDGWLRSDYDDSDWHAVYKTDYTGTLIPQEGELILEQEHFQPSVIHTPDGNIILDMGQNFAGHVQFRVSGEKGKKIALTMGEVLDSRGNFTMKNLFAEGAASISGEVGQRLEYILKDGEQEYKSIFLISGFRYVLLENWPEEVKAEKFIGIAVYSDIPFSGEFQCSNSLVNKLVENVRWSQKSNFVDIPGDCPTRERSGWTADMSVFAETACYLSNPRKFLKKWLEDYKTEQSADGNLPFVVPGAGKPTRQRGCMGWSNAICNISMVLYRFYGEKDDLRDVYDCVKKFVDFNIERAKERNKFLLFQKKKYREYIIETGFHYGEWLEPGRAMYKDYVKALFFPDTEVTTAWFYETTKQLAEMAEILGMKEDAEKYKKLKERLKEAYQYNFLPKGRVISKRQCRYVRPLAMGLLDEKQKKETAKCLNSMCIKNGYRVGTGFLTTYKLLTVLTENGYTDTAYKILENEGQPGWLYAVTKGATTTWENWYGITEKQEPVDSHNHFAPGAVVAWLFQYCAGIQAAEPGFTKIRIQPAIGGTFTWVKCSYYSVYGKITSNWNRKGNSFKLYVEIPPKVTAEIIMPDMQRYYVEMGVYTFGCTLPVL